MKNVVKLSIVCAVMAQTFVFGQDTTRVEESILKIPSISIVTNNRLQLPFSAQNRDVMVLDQEVIESLPIQSVNELLEYVSGVDVRQRGPWGGQADIAINGGTFDQTLILINGVKVIDPQTGHLTMNLPVPLEAIERVEVLKGAASSRYGINALNGVINIITKQPEQSGITFVAGYGTSFESDSITGQLYNGISLDIIGNLVGKNSNHLLALSTIQSSGHRYNTGMNNNKLFYDGIFRLDGGHSLQITAGGIYNDFGANGFYAAPTDINSREIVGTANASIKGNFIANSRWRIMPTVSYRFNNDDYIFVRENPEIYRNIHKTNVVNAIIDNSIATKAGIIGFGLEYRSEHINSNSLGKWNRDNFGLYAEFAFTMVKNLNITAGTYLNYSKHFKFNVLPAIDASYRFAKHWQVYASFGTGTRVPTYTDWYYKGPSNIGNDQLTPENSYSTEAGIRFNYKDLKISGNYFYRNVTDVIDWVRNDILDPWQTENFQRIQMQGMTLSADYQLYHSENKKGVNILTGISYTLLSPTVTQDYDQFQYSSYALDNLRNQLVARLNVGFLQDYNFSISGRYEERINSKGYFVLDTKISGEWNKVKVHLGLNNITNTTYIQAGVAPMPGRWMSLGVAYRLEK